MAIIILLIIVVGIGYFISQMISSDANKSVSQSYSSNGFKEIKIDVPPGYDYLSFNIAGTSFRRGLNKYVGEFDGQLVADPKNPYDKNAIKIIHEDGHHLGFIPADETDEVREFLPLPCECHGILVRGKDENDGHVFYYGTVVIVKKQST